MRGPVLRTPPVSIKATIEVHKYWDSHSGYAPSYRASPAIADIGTTGWMDISGDAEDMRTRGSGWEADNDGEKRQSPDRRFKY